jgi:hypothetical protein
MTFPQYWAPLRRVRASSTTFGTLSGFSWAPASLPSCSSPFQPYLTRRIRSIQCRYATMDNFIRELQSESFNRTNPVIKSSILPITWHPIAIWYPDPDIGPYRVAIYVRISAFSGYRASGYRTPTVLWWGIAKTSLAVFNSESKHQS